MTGESELLRGLPQQRNVFFGRRHRGFKLFSQLLEEQIGALQWGLIGCIDNILKHLCESSQEPFVRKRLLGLRQDVQFYTSAE